MVAVLKAVDARMDGESWVRVLLENHPDFISDDHVEILAEVGSDRIAVFRDIINLVSMLLDPVLEVTTLAPWGKVGHTKDSRLGSQYVDDGFHRRGFDVEYCYRGGDVAYLGTLIGILVEIESTEPSLLSIEGLDNYPGVVERPEHLGRALAYLQELAG